MLKHFQIYDLQFWLYNEGVILKGSDAKMLTKKEIEIVKRMIEVEVSYLEEQIQERSEDNKYVLEMQKRKTELEIILAKISSTESNTL